MDFSTTGAAAHTPLGFGQIQELRDAILQLAEAKKQRLGESKFKMQAITDTFGELLSGRFGTSWIDLMSKVCLLTANQTLDSQIQYYLASAFDEISMEPVGQLPLYGISSVNFFFKNMLDKVWWC